MSGKMRDCICSLGHDFQVLSWGTVPNCCPVCVDGVGCTGKVKEIVKEPKKKNGKVSKPL